MEVNATASILVHGGSKGGPDKNIRSLGGMPLIASSIGHALAVKRIDRVIVSTDSEVIAPVAREYGAEVPFIRPVELAREDRPEWLALLHALSYLLETDGVLLQAMFPFLLQRHSN